MTRSLVAILAVAACTAPPPGPAELASSVQAMLAASADAWNRGDLDGFVSDYRRDSATSFVAAGRVHRGHDWIRGHYAPRFAPGAARDSLRFESVAARALGGEHALATARYVLFRDGAVTSSGPFSLVLQRSDGGWTIIHDHTSRDPD